MRSALAEQTEGNGNYALNFFAALQVAKHCCQVPKSQVSRESSVYFLSSTNACEAAGLAESEMSLVRVLHLSGKFRR